MLKIDLNFIICIVAAGMWIRLMILDIIYHEIFNINDVVFFIAILIVSCMGIIIKKIENN